MDQTLIQELAREHGTPALSIFCALDTKDAGNDRDPKVLAALEHEADDRIETQIAGPDAAATLRRRVSAAIASIDLAHPTAGVAIYVSPETSRVVALPRAVENRVLLGNQFALRDLIDAAGFAVPARVIVLSRELNRCFDVTGGAARERRDHGFPVAPPIVPDTNAPHRDFPLAEHGREEAAKDVFRSVHRAVQALQNDDPRDLVLVGDERDLSYWNTVAGTNSGVVGRVHGNHERDTAAEIARLIAPVLEEHAEAQRAAACARAREAVSSTAVAGMADVWTAAQAGRGRLLLVERGYNACARDVHGELRLLEREARDSFDAVEATIAAVARHGGEIEIVPDGALSDLDGIVLQLRY